MTDVAAAPAKLIAVSDWRDVIDIDRLVSWMDERGLGTGPVENPHPLGGGSQNLLLAFRRSGRDYVLRHPPRHSVGDGSKTMRREARVLGALAGTNVPHPGLIAACDDEGVLGASFFLMEPIEGFNVSAGLPPLHAGDPAIRQAMGLSLIDGLVTIGRLDPVALGIADLGRVEGFLERQVGRWRDQLESYARFEGWEGPAPLGNLAPIADWLDRNWPPKLRPGIMHGDFHISNVMFRNDSPALAAIFDWEMATIGDPLLDLGWLLATWPDDEGRLGATFVEPWQGFPSADDLIARYAQAGGRDLTHLLWYRLLACYKLAIVLEGTHARACAGRAPKATGLALHRHAVSLITRAHELLERS